MNILKYFILFFITLCNAKINLIDNKVVYTIALKQKNTDILEKTLLDISDYKSENYGKYLSKSKILDIIKPSNKNTNKVTEWLKKHNTYYVNKGDAIVCMSNIKDVESMFDINIVKNGSTYKILNYRDYTIPNKLRNIIEFIEGLSNNNYDHSIKKHSVHKSSYNDIIAQNTDSIIPDTGAVGREVINKLYNITWNKIMSQKVSMGSIEYQNNGGFLLDDLLLSQKENSENQKNVSKNHIVGMNEDSDMESQLDMQMMSQIAENVDLWFWDEPEWLYSFAVNFFNNKTVPDVISMSWGWSESDQCSITKCNNKTASQYINRVNIEYIKIGLRGVTITVASGDSGAPGRVNEICSSNNPINPVFPGSSPWVTSIGGTFIVNSKQMNNWTTPLCKQYGCSNGNIEMNSNYDYTGWTAGGGFSIYGSELRPYWQNNFVKEYLNSDIPLPKKFNNYGRGYPDVSIVSHKCAVFDSGNLYSVDGTSCSSPIFAGIVSLLNDYQVMNDKPKLGFINPILYAMAEYDKSIYNDLIKGNNSCTESYCCPVREDNGSDFGYIATKGWDPVYGLGTPNVGKMIEWLSINI
mgnify:CR=1 FL=1